MHFFSHQLDSVSEKDGQIALMYIVGCAAYAVSSMYASIDPFADQFTPPLIVIMFAAAAAIFGMLFFGKCALSFKEHKAVAYKEHSFKLPTWISYRCADMIMVWTNWFVVVVTTIFFMSGLVSVAVLLVHKTHMTGLVPAVGVDILRYAAVFFTAAGIVSMIAHFLFLVYHGIWTCFHKPYWKVLRWLESDRRHP